MERRSYLVSIAAGSLTSVAGCMNVLAGENEPTGYSIVVQSPEDPLLDHSVSIVGGGYADPETPLMLEVELSNSSEQTVGYYETRNATFHLAKDEDDRYYLLPMKYNDEEYREFEDDHWKVVVSELTQTAELRTGRLEPGETATKKRVLALRRDVNPPESRPDEIKFSTSYAAGKMPEYSKSDPKRFLPKPSGRESYSWGFSFIQE